MLFSRLVLASSLVDCLSLCVSSFCPGQVSNKEYLMLNHSLQKDLVVDS